MQHCHLVCFAELAWYREIGACAHIGADSETYRTGLLLGFPVLEFTVSEKQIGRRAVCHSASASVQGLPFIFLHYAAVCHYRASAEKTEMTVHLSVVRVRRIELSHPVYLALSLVKMCMHIYSLIHVAPV